MVNFLHLFYPELQKLLKPIYDLTRKGKQFWGEKINKMLLMKLKGDYKNQPYYIYKIIRADFIYIRILINLPQEVLYIRFRMANQNEKLM